MTQLASYRATAKYKVHSYLIYQCFGGLSVLGFSMTFTRDEVLADLSILLNHFLPSGALTDSMLQQWYKFFFHLKARATASDPSGSSKGVSLYKQTSLEQALRSYDTS